MDALLTIKDVARILGRAEKTIRNDLIRKPSKVPPRVQLDGIRQLRWKAETVQDWIDGDLQEKPAAPKRRSRPKRNPPKGAKPIESLPLFPE